MSDTFGYTLTDRIACITIDDGKVNAMSLDFFQGLGAALDRAEADDAGAVVIMGRPGVFSAGLNLKLLPTLPPDELNRTMLAFGRTMLRVFTFGIPTVAAVSGHAVAGGAMLAFACDLRHVADGAFRMQLNEVAIGLTLPSWAIAIAQSAVPKRWHTEALLHARTYAPVEALERGIVDVVTPPDKLLESAVAAATPLLALDKKAYAGSKRRHRAPAVAWAEAQLEKEMTTLPSRATVR